MVRRTLMIAFCAMLFSSLALAAKAEDFTYRGVALGDGYDQMAKALGAPGVDIDHMVGGRRMTYYIYRDVRIGVDAASGEIADIRIADKKYEALNGVKLGATPHKIIQEYGAAKKERIGGHTYYIYRNAAKPEERLMLDVSAGYLEEIRITRLNA